MKAKTLALFLFFISLNLVSAQQPLRMTGSEFVYNAQSLKTVNFDATSPFDTYLIKLDDGNLVPIPQWDASASNNSGPVCYVSGATPELTAVFTNCTTDLWIKGVSSLNLEVLSFPPLQLSPSTDGTVTYGPQTATIGSPAMIFSFPSETIRYIEEFSIVWKMCNVNSNNESDWQVIATSINPVYVTYKKPDSTIPFETVLHLGCSNANGLSGPAAEATIVNALFTPFLSTNFEVRRKGDNQVMTYYASIDPDNSCSDLATMLKSPDADGRCGAMAELFNTMIKDQGIGGSNGVAITAMGTVPPNSPPVVPLTNASKAQMSVDAINQFGVDDIELDLLSDFYHFMVKNWSGYAEGTFLPLPGGDYEEAKSSVGDPGIPGQGNITDPRSIFINHIFITYGGKIYDPSYGLIQNNADLANYEDNSLNVVSGTIVYRLVNNVKQYYS